ncbi:MAG: PLP-dependent aminotransferase family protein, partial [Nevskiales bacterium]
DPEGLAALLEKLDAAGRRVKFLYTVPTCHNPTGGTLSLERRQAILVLADQHGMLVLEDNTYGAIRFSAPPPAFIALDPERTIHLGSFSKTIAPGLRAGWIATRPELVTAINSVRTDLGVSPLAQRVVTRFVQSDAFPRRLEQLSSHYRAKRDRMLAGLKRHCRGLAEWQVPEGGFFVWLYLTGCTAAAALDTGEAEKVSFMPGSYFAAEPGMLASHVRLSYGELAAGEIDEGLRQLGQALARASG